jgi:hypothetical protein
MLATSTGLVKHRDWGINQVGVGEPVSVFEDGLAQLDLDGDEAEDLHFEILYRVQMDRNRLGAW